jgi:hypothetical protein
VPWLLHIFDRRASRRQARRVTQTSSYAGEGACAPKVCIDGKTHPGEIT